MENIKILFEMLGEVEQDEKSYIRDLRIADIIVRLESFLMH